MRSRSIINPEIEIAPESWLISALNYKGSTSASSTRSVNCHSLLIVEGIQQERAPSGALFVGYKPFIGRYEITGLLPADKHSRVLVIPKGMPCPARIPQDAILLCQDDKQVTAYWRQLNSGSTKSTEAELPDDHKVDMKKEHLKTTPKVYSKSLKIDDGADLSLFSKSDGIFEITRQISWYGGILLFSSDEDAIPDDIPPHTILLRKHRELVTAHWMKGSIPHSAPIAIKDHSLEEIMDQFPGLREKIKKIGWKTHPALVNKLTSICVSSEVNNDYVNIIVSKFGCKLVEDEMRDRSLFNKKALISEIRCQENEQVKYRDEYGRYPYRSFPVTPSQARKMIRSIEYDQKLCEQAILGECDYMLYQRVGENHFLTEAEKGLNCTSWCIKHLIVAGLSKEVRGTKSKPKELTGQKCTIL